MKLVELQNDALVFNWEHLPEKIQVNTELRDKLFNEVKNKFPLNKFIDTKLVFEINKYVIDRLKSELKRS